MTDLKEAYDVKKLVAKFEAEGIPMLEKDCEKATNIVLDFLADAAAASDEGVLGQIDDFVAGFIPKAKLLLAKVFDFNKDGKVG